VPEKEIILIITKKNQTDAVFDAVIKAGKLDKKGQGFAYIHTIDRAIGFLEDFS
jgi:nitrogen regulatory protein PII